MRNKKRNRIFLLLILLLGISIGFAALATTLKINGNASITKNTWDIYWDNIANKSGVTPTTEPVISADENNVPKTLVTWGVTLDKPGDYYEFTVDAVNNGSLDAMITSIESKINNSPIKSTVNGQVVVADPSPVPSFIKYSVKYADGEEIELNHLLAKKTNDTPTRETYKIRVEYDRNAVTNSDVNNQQSDTTYTFSFAVTYGQADDNARDRHASSLALGDYVTVVPDETIATTSIAGFSGSTTTADQTLWRVIKINDDGTYDAVSHYASTGEITPSGADGYKNYVAGLQDVASKYANANYTVGTRALGYDGQTLSISDSSAFDGSTASAPSTTSSTLPTTGTGEEYLGGVAGDTLYLKDYLLVKNIYGNLSATTKAGEYNIYYCLASRVYSYRTSPGFEFRLAYISSSQYDGVLGSNGIITKYNNEGYKFYIGPCKIRPIITIKKNVVIDSGTGTKNDPYIFE